MKGALCTDRTDLFFSPAPDDVAQARALCRACPVREACLEEALVVGWAYADGAGIWAGTSPPQRRLIRRQRQRAESGQVPA